MDKSGHIAGASISFDDAFFEDPYATYRKFRDEAPVFLDSDTGLWMAFSHGAVKQALFDYDRFSSARGNTINDSPQRVGRTLGSMDPPRHDVLRPIIMRGFTAKRIAASVEELCADAAERMRSFDRGSPFDFVRDFSRPVLYSALGRMLGLEGEAARTASDVLANLFKGADGPLGLPLPEDDMKKLFVLLKEQLDYRKRSPSDDLFSVMIAAQDAGAPLTDEVILGNLSTVLLAGNASIGHFFPNIFNTLHLHPAQRRQVLDRPDLIPALIEEAVRWDTSTQCFARQTTQEVELSGVVIPAESRLVLFYASASRDDTVIEQGEVFDIARGKVQHFGFGAGVHHCLGAMTAKRMLTPLLQQILPDLGEFSLDLSKSRRVQHVMVRGFSSLIMERA